MIALSLRGGSLRGHVDPSVKRALRTWVNKLRNNKFYAGDGSRKARHVWSFKWDETSLISDAGYENEFNTPGIYMFLRDGRGPHAYEPIYIGMAGGQGGSLGSQSISERLYQRYIPKDPDHPYKPPKQLQIVRRYGNEIRRNHSAWHKHRKQLESQGASKVRLDHAEFFSKLTVVGPYLTFCPLPREQGEEMGRHKLRIRAVELALIQAAKDLGFELCNK